MEKILVPTSSLRKVFSRVEAINKKAKKLGLDCVVEVKISNRMTTESLFRIASDMTELTVEGKAPDVAGAFQLVGAVRHLEAGDLALDFWPEIDFTEFMGKGPFCDHCKKIRGRKVTFVIRERATGVLMRVGKTCLQEYFPQGAAAYQLAVAAFEECLNFPSLFGEEHAAGGTCGNFSTRQFLAFSFRSICLYGYKSPAHEDSSKNRVFSALDLQTREGKQKEAEHVAPTSADYEKVEGVFSWVDSLDRRNQFFNNIHAAVKNPAVERTAGLLVAAALSFLKHLERLEEEKLNALNPSKHVGSIGQRNDFENLRVKINRKLENDSDFTSYLVKLEDGDGNQLVTFTSASWVYEVEEGDLLKGRGTVKDHSTYRGVAQTVLSRCKFQKMEGTA